MGLRIQVSSIREVCCIQNAYTYNCSEEWCYKLCTIFPLLQEGSSLVKKVKGTYLFKITGDNGNTVEWLVDLKNGNGSVTKNPGVCVCVMCVCNPIKDTLKEPNKGQVLSYTDSIENHL